MKKYLSQYLFSDVNPYEVVEVKTENKLMIRKMNAELTEESKKAIKDSCIPGGFCCHRDNSLQEWVYSSNEDAPVFEVRRHKDGKYYMPGTRTCPFVLHDEPYKWYDFNF